MKGNSHRPKLILVFTLFLFSQFALAASPCEVNFVKYINGDMPADVSKNPMINMWDERFDPELVVKQLKQNSDDEIKKYISELAKLIHKDSIYNDNIAHLLTRLYKDKKIDIKFLQKRFLDAEFEHASFYYSKSRKEITSQLDLDPAKIDYVKKKIKAMDLDEFYEDEYIKTLLQSNRSLDELQIAFEGGMKLNQNAKDLEQFKKYFDFIDNSKPHRVKKALKNINKIYNYTAGAGVLPFNPMLTPHKQFLKQNARMQKFEARRVTEIERGLKLQQKSGIVDEIDEAIEREANGYVVRIQEKFRFKKKLDDVELPHALKQRAKNQARHEANIYRRMLNGCNSGSSQRLESAAKKFARFKFALALGMTPALYVYKNGDKMDTDPYFWEKLGHEIGMGLFFTFVGNKIITNTGSTFWRKYLEGYIKFGALSYADAWTYDELFGKKSLVRHFQKIYKSDVPESELRVEFEKLKNSPTFEKDMDELISYLDEMSKKKNTKNFLDKYLNLSTYSSLDDEVRITQQDLESEEAREMMMELLAERIYLQNMGSWPFFQSGSKANDRFLFYRARNVVWDIKTLMINLAIFELMCREPFGKIGSWGAILGIVIGDQMFSGDFTYEYRREAINQ